MEAKRTKSGHLITSTGHGSIVGGNCGTGAGGFKGGNKCQKGGSAGSPDKSKFIGAKVDGVVQRYADSVEYDIANGVGGKRIGGFAKGNGSKAKGGGYSPTDVHVKRGTAIDAVEVKSMTVGKKRSITVHDDALLRKVDYLKTLPKGSEYHTVLEDRRAVYNKGANKEAYSGHQIYYKRGSGRYSLSKMHKVKDYAELKRLIAAKYKDLPAAAKGKLPPPPSPASLRRKAEIAHASRLLKDRTRIAKKRNAK